MMNISISSPFLWRDGNLQITIIIIQIIYHSDIYKDVNIIICMWYIMVYYYHIIIAYIHHFEDVSPMSSRRAAAF